MPQRAAEALRDEIANRGPVKIEEAEAAQKAIAASARRLAAEGSISLPGKGPAYV
jgi:flagellar motor switch protein FliG